jgi:tetratricopeptide (TPR) repeat protein
MLLTALAPALAAQPTRRTGDQFALLVGVRKYHPNELRDLPYAEADVEGLAKTLRAAGYPRENVVLLTQAAAAKDLRFAPESGKIRSELKLLLQNRNREDTVLVAFAGHGVQFRDEAESYFCPADARLGDKSTLVSLSEVYQELERCPAGVKVLLVDACRNDPLADHSRARATVRLESSTRPGIAEPPAGVVALFSCSKGERAFEHDELKHGVFFHYVIEGLEGKAAPEGEAEVTVGDLEGYVQRQVDRFVRARFGASQKPERRGQVSGAFPLARVEGFADLRRGKKQFEERQYEAAVASLTKVLRVNPRHIEALALRARANVWLRRYDEAEADGRQAVDLDPQSTDAHVARAYALRGRKEYDRAIAECDEALRLDPKSARAYAVRGFAYALKGDNDRALADLDQAVGLAPKHAEYLTERGYVHHKLGEPARALADLEAALRLKPDLARAHYYRGLVRADAGRLDEAIADYTRALQFDLKLGLAYFWRGEAYLAKKDYAKALADADEAVRLEPTNGWAHNLRGNVHLAQGRHDQAIAEFTAAIGKGAATATFYNNRGHTRHAAGDSRGALADLDEAVRLNPKYAKAYLNRAAAHQALNDNKQAAADLQTGLRLSAKK